MGCAWPCQASKARILNLLTFGICAGPRHGHGIAQELVLVRPCVDVPSLIILVVPKTHVAWSQLTAFRMFLCASTVL